MGEYITHYGEEAFRAQETALLTQLGKASGLVIATGGGCVTRPENYPHLHQNGAIIFLERELSKLPKKGRLTDQVRVAVAPGVDATLSAPHLSTRSKSSRVLMPPPTVRGMEHPGWPSGAECRETGPAPRRRR